MVAYQNILKLTYIDKFLTEIQQRFRDLYKNQIQKGQLNHDFSGFQEEFDAILKECEAEAREALQNARKPMSYNESAKSSKTVSSMVEKKTGIFTGLLSSEPAKENVSSSNKKAVQEAEKVDSNLSSDDMSQFTPDSRMKKMVAGGRPKKFEKKKAEKVTPTSPKKGKTGTKWNDGGHEGPLDYGGEKSAASAGEDKCLENDLAKYASKSDVGKYKGDLQGIEIEEEDDDEEEEEQETQPLKNISNKSKVGNGAAVAKKTSSNGKAVGGGIFSSLKSLVGAKVLTEEMIAPVMEKMQDHLIGEFNVYFLKKTYFISIINSC